jgi:hypothetical protein
MLEELREAAFAGEVSSRQEAIDHARRQVAGPPGAGRDR